MSFDWQVLRRAWLECAALQAESLVMNFWVDLFSLMTLCVAMPRWIVGMLRGRYRWQDLAVRLTGQTPQRNGDSPCLWLHAASVGEVNVLLKLLPAIERQYPEYELFISSATTSGYQLARKGMERHSVIWFPLSFSWAARRALQRLRPAAIVLVDMEMAPSLIDAARRRGVGVFVVNGRLSQRRQRLLRAWPKTTSHCLQAIDGVLAQSVDDAIQFVNFGARPETVEITGSIKFDCIELDREQPRAVQLRELANISDDDVVFLAGSTKAGEEQAALDAFCAAAKDYPQLKLLVAPRNASRFDLVARLLDASGQKWQRRSALAAGGTDSSARILLIDSVGELQQWWATADIAFVGGSLHAQGGQNMIEPAAYGAAVCFGPQTQNFRDVVSLLVADDAAEVIRSDAELSAFVRRCLDDRLYAETLGWRARQVVQQQSGALEATVAALDRVLVAMSTKRVDTAQANRQLKRAA